VALDRLGLRDASASVVPHKVVEQLVEALLAALVTALARVEHAERRDVRLVPRGRE
jgi:hypothetical protein